MSGKSKNSKIFLEIFPNFAIFVVSVRCESQGNQKIANSTQKYSRNLPEFCNFFSAGILKKPTVRSMGSSLVLI